MDRKIYTLSLNCDRCNDVIQSVRLSFHDLLESAKVTEKLSQDLHQFGAISIRWDLNEERPCEVILCSSCVLNVKNVIGVAEKEQNQAIILEQMTQTTPNEIHESQEDSSALKTLEKVEQRLRHDDYIVIHEKAMALKEKTGVPLAYCKTALKTCGGDPEKAEQRLRHNGYIAGVEKKQAKQTKQEKGTKTSRELRGAAVEDSVKNLEESTSDKPKSKNCRPVSQRYPLTDRQRRVFIKIAAGRTSDSGLSRGKKEKPLNSDLREVADLLCKKGLLRKDKNAKQYHLTEDGRARYDGLR